MNKFLNNLDQRKKNIALIISGAVISFIITKFGLLNINTTSWILVIGLVLFSIVLLIIMVLSGFTVIKALFDTSIGLSLIIFLGQAYCNSVRTDLGDKGLRSLITIGILYVIFDFIKTLYKGVNERYKMVENKEWSLEKILLTIFFIFFIGVFMWTIYQVINPIILSLCIYKI